MIRGTLRSGSHSLSEARNVFCQWFFPAAVSDETVLVCANVTLVVPSEVSIFHGNICWQMFCIKVASLAYNSKLFRRFETNGILLGFGKYWCI